MAAEPVAVLLMAYGGPNSLAEVEPYLLDVRGGRPTKPELVEEIRERYAEIGGRSPIRELTEAQAAGLGRALGPGYTVRVGMRHWHPYIKETVDVLVAGGARRVIGVAMAPHFSTMSVAAYEKKLREAVAGRLEVAMVERWGEEPKFLDAVAAHVQAARARFPTPERVQVLFTAHSLPQRILTAGDPYPTELRASADAVARRLGLTGWLFAFQSAGATPEPWLGPDVESVIRELAGRGQDAFLVVPIGFICDHVEILYDIDVELRRAAAELGVRLERTASLNDDPLLVGALADVVRRAARDHGWD
ncbi:MAG TPA: ferrochelatase [Gemmatimonadales bacterium]|nr:ferrochelatase [Gemmatimonadales bacterium]